MTDDDLTRALDNLHSAFGDPLYTLVRAKCPRCRRWCLRSPFLLKEPCYLCKDVGEPFRMWDLLLMVEFGLSWSRYQAKLEKDGPPWLNPKAWTSTRAKQEQWRKSRGTGRPKPEPGDGGDG